MNFNSLNPHDPLAPMDIIFKTNIHFSGRSVGGSNGFKSNGFNEIDPLDSYESFWVHSNGSMGCVH